jgi:hypothetical protein
MQKAVLLIVAATGLSCSSGKQAETSNDATRGAARPWSLGDLPAPDLPDAVVRELAGVSEYRLSFEHDSERWVLSDVERTNAQLNNTEITFLFTRVPIGAGDRGLANLRHLLSRLPRGTKVLADHCLTCQTNRWSERIREISRESEASNGVGIVCDGAF